MCLKIMYKLEIKCESCDFSVISLIYSKLLSHCKFFKLKDLFSGVKTSACTCEDSTLKILHEPVVWTTVIPCCLDVPKGT